MRTQPETMPPENVVVPPRLRNRLDEDRVRSLMESIKEIGLQHPIHIRWHGDNETDETPVLVAGRHRLEACIRLGMTQIGVLAMGGTEAECRLWEIAENLHRAELTAQERAEHIGEWVRLTEEKQAGEGVSAQLGPKLSTRGRVSEGRPEGGINAAVRELGITRQEGQRAVKIASMDPEAKQIAREAGLDDNQSVLLAVARKPEAEQAQAIREEHERRLRAAAEVAALRARRQRTALAALKRKWGKASAEERQAFVSLDKWKTLDDPTKGALLAREGPVGHGFNRQDGDSIEWAQWSWNPITGCLHDCPYCYARDIATLGQTARAFPNGFAPTLKPAALRLPANLRPPKQADTDARFKNVFCGSMADWFGRWVPEEWIEAVLATIRRHPEWNFLCLTKFPKRMAEFDIPANMWAGTTVDLQARVKNAEAAFANVNAAVRWLSIEPMLEPLRFSRLDLFQWIVIGGASRSSKTPSWQPPFEWTADLVRQAREAGVKVYFKTNLLGNRILELPFDAPIARDPQEAPEVFRYLGRGEGQG